MGRCADEGERALPQARLEAARRVPRARCIHLILDNYIIHSSKRTKRFLTQFGDRVVLHFLPPYCPVDARFKEELERRKLTHRAAADDRSRWRNHLAGHL